MMREMRATWPTASTNMTRGIFFVCIALYSSRYSSTVPTILAVSVISVYTRVSALGDMKSPYTRCDISTATASSHFIPRCLGTRPRMSWSNHERSSLLTSRSRKTRRFSCAHRRMRSAGVPITLGLAASTPCTTPARSRRLNV
jgi:hypothetical protein